jgi:hypothetical protein
MAPVFWVTTRQPTYRPQVHTRLRYKKRFFIGKERVLSKTNKPHKCVDSFPCQITTPLFPHRFCFWKRRIQKHPEPKKSVPLLFLSPEMAKKIENVGERSHQEETRLAMVSVPESDFLGKIRKN